MADSRFNQMPGYPGGPPVGPQGGGMQPHFIQATRPINPMMQQPMMMPFAMQGMRMALPNTPPPPYGAHLASPAVVNMNQRRTTLSKSKGQPKSEKERFFEEQRQKLKQFGKPGAAKVDADSLIGAMFKPDPKPASKTGKAQNSTEGITFDDDDDDGFGDFLQGPSVQSKPPELEHPVEVSPASSPEPATLSMEEKKDLKSMMLECSDLMAPQKAKGFHKPSLNEVHHRPGHERHRKASFHESDHSRSWKHTGHLDGLFQLPVQAPVVPVQAGVAYPGHVPVPQTGVPGPGQPVVPVGHPGVMPMRVPTGPPPAYAEALNHPSSPIMVMPTTPTSCYSPDAQNTMQDGMAFNYPNIQPQHVPPQQVPPQQVLQQQVPPQQVPPQQVPGGPVKPPDWCSADESQLPPLYKQVLDASLVDGQIATERLYPILLLSSLPKEKLAQIWSLCNTATPGQLQKFELWQILALIALAQNNIDTSRLAVLGQVPIPPIPMLLTPNNGAEMGARPAMQNGVAFTPSTSPAPAPSPGLVAPPSAPSPGIAAPPSASPGPPPQQSVYTQPQPQVQPPYQVASSPSLSLSSTAVSVTSADDDFSDFQAAPSPSSQAVQPSAGKSHTSPSFEDDDFTDGRDSLSQISTSEQSENEDIRNFESYVEEFNHKAKAPTGSPLHCPFPSVQQAGNTFPKVAKAATSASVTNQPFPVLPQPGQQGRPRAETDINTNSHKSTKSSLNKASSIASQPSASDDFADFKSVQLTVPRSMSMSVASTSLGAAGTSGKDDFADFKSASIPPPSSFDQSPRPSSSASGDDKYGAFRTLDDDLMTSSVFEAAAFDSSLNAANAESSTTSVGDSKGNGDEEDDWANFAEAPPATDAADTLSAVGQLPSSLDASQALDKSSSAQSSSGKEDILKLFASNTNSKTTAMTSSGTSEGSASMVNSDSGYSTKSSFFDTTPTSSGQPDVNEKESVSSWSQSSGAGSTTQNTRDGNWANFGADQNNVGIASSPGQFGSTPIIVSSQDGGGADFGQFPPSQGESSSGDKPAKGEEDWGDFAQTSASSSSMFPPEGSSGGLWSNTSDDSGNWANFSGPMDGSVGENSSDSAVGANMVMIKKQNLGTNEIMGVFKVRNDPATLSTYQLPAKPPPPAGSSRVRKHSSGHRRNLSSEVDDDMVPPPMDSDAEDGDDDGSAFSRGYDLDDYMHRQTPITTYSPFGVTNTSPYATRAGKSLTAKVTGSNEDSGSVHSLELPSVKPYDSATGDSQSVSSSDMNSGMEGSNAGGVWKSIESLDLPSDSLDASEEAYKDETPSEPPSQTPIQPQELLASMPRLADKYNIDGEAQGNDRYRIEWERCLTNCCEILTEANTLFNDISSSSICNEVLKASQGSDYVSCVIEIYRVGCRVMTAMTSTAISSSELEQTLKQIDLVWNNLSAFLVGASLLPDQSSLVFQDAVIKADADNSSPSQTSACGLCLLNVDYSPASASASSSAPLSSTTILSSLCRSESVSRGISSKLTFAGRQYHSTCANFWVNCVDQTLPSLDLPELL